MHQDQWHEQYGGEGVPDWAAVRQPPYNLAPPVVAPFPTGYWTPEVSSMFDDFWADRRGLLTGWVQAWALAAKQWRRQPYLMGYDLLNEPWMGTEWPTCLADGCPQSYADELQPAMERGLAAIRAGRQAQHRLVGAAAVRRRPAARHVLRGRAGGGAARLLVAQLLPGRLPRVAGRPRRRRRELRGVRRGPAGPRPRAVGRDARRPDDERVGRDRHRARDPARRRRSRPAPDGLDPLGLQAVERPDDGRHRPRAVRRRHGPRVGQDREGPPAGPDLRAGRRRDAAEDALPKRLRASSASSTSRTARSRRPP